MFAKPPLGVARAQHSKAEGRHAQVAVARQLQHLQGGAAAEGERHGLELVGLEEQHANTGEGAQRVRQRAQAVARGAQLLQGLALPDAGGQVLEAVAGNVQPVQTGEAGQLGEGGEPVVG